MRKSEGVEQIYVSESAKLHEALVFVVGRRVGIKRTRGRVSVVGELKLDDEQLQRRAM